MYSLFACYNSVADFLEGISPISDHKEGTSQRIYLSHEQRMEPVPNLNVIKITRQITLQIIEAPDLVRCLIFVVGVAERAVSNGTLLRNEEKEASLRRHLESGLSAVEYVLEQRGYRIERAKIAMPVFLQMTNGIVEFLKYDEITDTFTYKEEGEYVTETTDDLSGYKM